MKNINSELETNKKKDFVTYTIPKISFIFVTLLVISGGFCDQLLSCELQRQLKNNLLFKHIIGIGLMFMFIMLEGGWSLNNDLQNESSVDWSNGDSVSSLIYAFLLYIILIAISKQELKYNLLIFGILFILYMINTQRAFYYNRNRISEDLNKKIARLELITLLLLPFLLLFGNIQYYFIKKKEFKDKFSIITFFIGKNKCND